MIADRALTDCMRRTGGQIGEMLAQIGTAEAPRGAGETGSEPATEIGYVDRQIADLRHVGLQRSPGC